MSPQVDFYQATGSRPGVECLLACRLAAKAFGHELTTWILTTDSEQVRYLDQLLWTYDDCSFVPHEPSTGDGRGECPVVIAHHEPEPAAFDVLISLCDNLPGHRDYRRIIDVITGGDNGVARARERFRHYRTQGFEPNYHQLSF